MIYNKLYTWEVIPSCNGATTATIHNFRHSKSWEDICVLAEIYAANIPVPLEPIVSVVNCLPFSVIDREYWRTHRTTAVKRVTLNDWKSALAIRLISGVEIIDFSVFPLWDSLEFLVCCRACFLYRKRLRNLFLQFVSCPTIKWLDYKQFWCFEAFSKEID